MRKLINLSTVSKNAEIINPPTKMSLDELYEEARRYGEVRLGDIFSNESAELICNFTGEDRVYLKSRHLPTLKENIAQVIVKARGLKEFHRQQKNS